MVNPRLEYLFTQLFEKSSTAAEKEELMLLIKESANDEQLKLLMGEAWNKVSPAYQLLQEKSERIFANILAADIDEKLISINRSRYWLGRIAVAASILLIISIGSYFLFFKKDQAPTEIAKVPSLPNDIKAPATNKATITLANGQQVILDSAGNGTLAMQGKVRLVKLADGQIEYSGVSMSAGEVEYNTLTNPRGSKVINLTLADGSKVWLNAESSLRYPTAFVGNERKVEVTGEAYFEVTHNAAIPFKVMAKGTEIKDLGTQFNVNAYDDEIDIKVTLLEGSVRVAAPSRPGGIKGGVIETVVIKPGEQAQVANNINVLKAVNLDEVMAWKNGNFYFNGLSFETIMRQVARWYDVEITYEGKVPTGHYKGKPSRDLTASQMLKVIEYSGVKFRIEGKKIIVAGE